MYIHALYITDDLVAAVCMTCVIQEATSCTALYMCINAIRLITSKCKE